VGYYVDYDIEGDAGCSQKDPNTNYGSNIEALAGWYKGTGPMFYAYRYAFWCESFSSTDVVNVFLCAFCNEFFGDCDSYIGYFNSSWTEGGITWNNANWGPFTRKDAVTDGWWNTWEIPASYWNKIDLDNWGCYIRECAQPQFVRLMTRNHSEPGVRPYVRVYKARQANSISGYQNGNSQAHIDWSNSNETDSYFNAHKIYQDSTNIYTGTANSMNIAQTNGTTKTYKVYGRYYSDNKGYVTSSGYSSCSITVKNAPYNINVTGGNRSALISWTGWPETVATKYQVYYSTDGTNFSLLGSTNNEYYNHTNIPAGTYYYKVKAHYSVGDSGYSAVDSCIVTCNPPTNVDVVGGVRQIDLSWTACNPEPDNYYIYKKRAGENYSLYDTISGSLTSYDDDDIIAGVYYFKLKAHYSDEDSGYSNEDLGTVTSPGPTALGAYDSRNDEDVGAIKLGGTSEDYDDPGAWTAPAAPSAPSSYKVYKSMEEFGTYSYLDTTVDSYYMDSGLYGTSGSPVIYWYKISAVYTSGEAEESQMSAAVYGEVVDSTVAVINIVTDGYVYDYGEELYVPSGDVIPNDEETYFTEGSGLYGIYIRPKHGQEEFYYGKNYEFLTHLVSSYNPKQEDFLIATVEKDGAILSNLNRIRQSAPIQKALTDRGQVIIF